MKDKIPAGFVAGPWGLAGGRLNWPSSSRSPSLFIASVSLGSAYLVTTLATMGDTNGRSLTISRMSQVTHVVASLTISFQTRGLSCNEDREQNSEAIR